MDTHSSNRTSQKARVTPANAATIHARPEAGTTTFRASGLRLTAFGSSRNISSNEGTCSTGRSTAGASCTATPVAMASPDKGCSGAEPGMLEIGEGLALDKAGRELVQTETVALTSRDAILLDDKGAPVRAKGATTRSASRTSPRRRAGC